MDTKKTVLVLVVEDEASYQYALTNKLKSHDFDVLTAGDGEEGLRVALEKHPDLILLDVRMPKMDGLEMLKRLREDDWGKDAKVIMLSTFDDDKYIAEAMAQETFDYFVKTDVRLDTLIEKINKKLGIE